MGMGNHRKITQWLVSLLPPAILWMVAFLVALIWQSMGVDPADHALAVTAVTDGIAIFVLLALWRKWDGFFPGSTPGSRSHSGGLLLVLLFCAGALCSAGSERLFSALGLYERFSPAAQQALLEGPIALQILALGVLAPVCEELAYRELSYGAFKTQIQKPAAALIVSVLFAAGHGNLLQFFYALPMGLLLCGCYELTGSIAGPIAFHAGANLISVILSAMTAGMTGV